MDGDRWESFEKNKSTFHWHHTRLNRFHACPCECSSHKWGTLKAESSGSPAAATRETRE